MSKKMKGVVLDSSYEDVRARFKHQILLQDYVQLLQETEAARNKLEAMKQKKLTLHAEVSFLRRRHKFLLKNKSLAPQREQVMVKPKRVDTTQSKKNKINFKKDAILRNLPPIHNLNEKGRAYTEKKKALSSKPPAFDVGRKVKSHGVKEQFLNNPSAVSQKENIFSSKEVVGQSRMAIFDLNEISIEEEEMQESFEEPRKGLANGVDEPQNDMKLSICRNVGDGSTSRSGKRKISWQDPVALRV